jgi:hypothetical protein
MSERDSIVRRHLSGAIDDLPIDVDGRLSELRRGGGRRPTQHRLAAIVVALAVAVIGTGVRRTRVHRRSGVGRLR